MNSPLASVASWLLTFLLHSTLWLGGVALLLRLRPGASAAVRDLLWRAALVASLLTPTAQLVASEGFGWRPLGGALLVGAADPDLSAPPPRPLARFAVVSAAASPSAPAADESGTAAPPPVAGSVPLRAERDAALPWTVLLLALWAAGAAGGLGLLTRGTLRFRRGLGAREEVGESASARALRKLTQQAGPRARVVRLTCSEELRVPVAIGVLRREICVPKRALRDLPPPQQRAMIGHEFAHLLRRDPAWLGLFEAMRRVFFFQPLLALAQRGAHEAAEEACDAWAARRTGDPVALAECLVEVARWLEPRAGRRSLPLAAACMARPDSPLARRVDALLAGAPDAPERAPRAWLAGALALPLVFAAFAPGVASAPEELSCEARLERVTIAMLEIRSELADAHAECAEAELAGSPTASLLRLRLARLGERLDALRAQADRLSELMQR